MPVTLEGCSSVGRAGVSILTNLGLPELIARGEDEYVARAASLAADLPALAALRLGLRERMRASPLCDGPRVGRDVGGLIRQAWREWCAGKAAGGQMSRESAGG